MKNVFTKLVSRAWDAAPRARPQIAPRFAPRAVSGTVEEVAAEVESAPAARVADRSPRDGENAATRPLEGSAAEPVAVRAAPASLPSPQRVPAPRTIADDRDGGETTARVSQPSGDAGDALPVPPLPRSPERMATPAPERVVITSIEPPVAAPPPPLRATDAAALRSASTPSRAPRASVPHQSPAAVASVGTRTTLEPAAPQPEPIQISIGRIEVRAMPAAPVIAPAKVPSGEHGAPAQRIPAPQARRTMSNFLAIATVTETLRYVLDNLVQKDVSGAHATAVSPSGTNNTGAGSGLPALGVNVFLYQVMPNATCRNLDLPTRGSDGSAIRRPRAAVDLHYMFSVYGAYQNREPHRVMGSVIKTLHEYAILSRSFIEEAVSTLTAGGALDLQGQNLSQDVELVKLVPLALTLDELSRVWSVYFQTSYALSVCYQASVVYLEDPAVPSTTALPVRTRNILSTPISPASIDTITPQPATGGALLTINGANVGAGAPLVRIGTLAPVPATVVSGTQITVTLPAGVTAGVSPLSVLSNVTFGPSTAPLVRPGAESPAVAMAVAPTLSLPATTVARGATFVVNFDTPIGPLQNVALVLDSYAVQLPARLQTSAPVTTFTFTIPVDAPTGLVPVRLQVDGVASALAFNTTTQQYTPSVTIS